MKPRYDEIPEELRVMSNWVGWRLEKRVTRSGAVYETKPPFNARTGKHAKANDPSTWSTFDEAVAAVERGDFRGIGFCL
jgi:primase-polymerase (primpol)-like protein